MKIVELKLLRCFTIHENKNKLVMDHFSTVTLRKKQRNATRNMKHVNQDKTLQDKQITDVKFEDF